jgi:NAD(P)-dependent dehydrogenase (short-subunit alcohol dehydrogenase family)
MTQAAPRFHVFYSPLSTPASTIDGFDVGATSGIELVEQTMVRFGRLDAVFNNAGYQERRARLAEQP